MIRVKVHDGKILGFPDGTSQEAIQRGVKSYMAIQRGVKGYMARPPVKKYNITPEFLQRSAGSLQNKQGLSSFGQRLSRPWKQEYFDSAEDGIIALLPPPLKYGAKLMRVGESTLAPSEQTVADIATGMSGMLRGGGNIVGGVSGNDKLGEDIWPSHMARKDSWQRTVGDVADPVAMAAGSGAVNLAVKALPKIGKWGSGVVGGLGGGAVIGGVTSSGDLDEAAVGAGIGGGIMAVLPPMLKYGAKGAGAVGDLLTGRSPRLIAGKMMRDMAGDDLKIIMQQLKDAPEGLTASQATHGVDRDVWHALAKYVETKDQDSFYRLLHDKQKLEELNKLAKLARGKTSEASAKARKEFKTQLEEELGPERSAALDKAGLAGREEEELGDEIQILRGGKARNKDGSTWIHPATGETIYTGRAGDIRMAGQAFHEAETQRLLAQGTANRKLGVSGQVKVDRHLKRIDELLAQVQEGVDAGFVKGIRISHNKKILQGIENAGLSPLSVTGLTSALKNKLKSKVVQVTPDMELVLNDFVKKVAIAAENGLVDPYALYQIRKTGVDQVISQLSGTATLSKEMTAKVLAEFKPLIDDAIEDAGGAGWRSYLKKYSEGFEELERIELMDEARRLYEYAPEEFIKFFKGDNKDLVEKVLGREAQVGDVFPSETMKILGEANAYLMQTSETARKASAGGAGMRDILKADTLRARLPAFIDKWWAAANKGIDVMEGLVSKKSMRYLSMGMRSGKGALELINTLPSSEKFAILRSLQTNNRIKDMVGGLVGANTEKPLENEIIGGRQ